MKSLKIHSSEGFKDANHFFKLAYENATKAFTNDALSIEDRIQASQVRIMATILDNLEHPDAAVRYCRDYLKQLHDIGAIQGTFSVLINGGIASWLNEAKRLDIASSVHLMNQLLYDFARKFTNMRLVMLDWPMILFDNRVYHPLLGEISLIYKLKEFGVRIISLDTDFTFGERIYHKCSVINSKREIIAASLLEQGTIKIFKSSGDSRIFCKVSPDKAVQSECQVVAMNIDAKDNIYLVAGFRERSYQQWRFILFVFDKNGNKMLEFLTPFHQNNLQCSSIAINKEGKIAIFDSERKMLHIGNLNTKFNESIHLNEISGRFVDIQYLDTKLIVVSNPKDTVYVYTDDGQLEHKFKIPERSSHVHSVAINYVTKRILVKMRDMELFTFSETGELLCNLYLGTSEWIRNAMLASHPNGSIALVCFTEAAFLQL